jgi:hypothetical protein
MATIDSRTATIQLLNSFLNAELEQVHKDRGWISDNVVDADKREKRLSYQDWRERQLLTLIALLGNL